MYFEQRYSHLMNTRLVPNVRLSDVYNRMTQADQHTRRLVAKSKRSYCDLSKLVRPHWSRPTQAKLCGVN